MRDRIKKELEELVDYLQSYRKETAKLALQVFENIEDVSVLFDVKVTYTIVESFLDTDDIYRVQDVAKMLSHTARIIKRNDEMPDEIKEKLKERMIKRGSITLRLV